VRHAVGGSGTTAIPFLSPPRDVLLRSGLPVRPEMRPTIPTLYLPIAAALLTSQASGQAPVFPVESEVTVRRDSFACKETSELDRLLRRNRTGAFNSGTQLYNYLQAHKCVGLTAGRARVYANREQYVCIYDPKNNNTKIYPCAWTQIDMLSR
jgi:hypothetical protein